MKTETQYTKFKFIGLTKKAYQCLDGKDIKSLESMIDDVVEYSTTKAKGDDSYLLRMSDGDLTHQDFLILEPITESQPTEKGNEEMEKARAWEDKRFCRSAYDNRQIPTLYFTETHSIKNTNLCMRGEEYSPYMYNYERMIDLMKKGILSEHPAEVPKEEETKKSVVNFEIEETLRQDFIDETKNKLWAVKGDNDCGFSEEYVFWLEQKVLKEEEPATEAGEDKNENVLQDFKGIVDEIYEVGGLSENGFNRLCDAIRESSQLQEPATEAERWISVDDRLPEINQPVFMYFGQRAVIGYYKGESGFLCSEDGEIWGIKQENITHWMPLPNPPKSI